MTLLKVPRGGKTISVAVPHKGYKRTKENYPIGAERVVGVDTETLTVSGMLQTVLIPYSTDEGAFCQGEQIRTDVDPIVILFDMAMEKFGQIVDRPSRATYRVNKGTRESITPCLFVFYNLEYDLQRLFNADSGFFRVLRQGRDDMIFEVDKYTVQVVNINPGGSAPSFQIIISHLNKVCRIYGMDMWGYWKTGLGKTAQSLGVGKKLSDDVPPEWFQIPLENWTIDMWTTFTQYAGTDAELTRGIYLATAELLGSFSKSVFNRNGMLPPSAPAAAARMAFSLASEEEWARPPKEYEQLALECYHGGYVAMLRRGYVQGLTVADLHSAYPSAMLLLPDPCTVKFALVQSGLWDQIPEGYRKNGCLGFVRATFTIKGAAFPSVSQMDKRFTLHQPGHYERFAISLPELAALFDLGHIDSAHVHAGYLLVGKSEESFLRKFVEWFYKIKSEEEERAEKEGTDKNTPLYLVAKLLMNALYGKLIEINEPSMPAMENIIDLHTHIVLPPDTPKSGKLFKEASQCYVTDGMPGLHKWSMRNIQLHLDAGSKETDILKMPGMQAHQILQSEQATAGTYFMPIFASLITAMTRAKLAIALNCFQSIGGDTDSFFTPLPYPSDEWREAEKRANFIALRCGVGGLENQPGLLGYGIEMVNGSGYVAGIKQYTLAAEGYKPKLAHHAITDPPGKTTKERNAFCSEAVKQLALGNQVKYTTRFKPRRLRESLLRNDGQYGIFVERERVVTPKEDERMTYVGTDDNGALIYEWTPLNRMGEIKNPWRLDE